MDFTRLAFSSLKNDRNLYKNVAYILFRRKAFLKHIIANKAGESGRLPNNVFSYFED